MSCAISPVALAERSASLRTSSATTAKPLPCSPARAASIAALRAKRLVCSAISSITAMMAPISSEDCPKLSITATTSAMAWLIRAMPSMV
ncbi:hypothetical protein D3C78_1785850 [compost metagenome]